MPGVQDGMGSVILQSSIPKDLSHINMARGGIAPTYSSEFTALARGPLRHGRLKGQARWARNSGEAPGRRTTTGSTLTITGPSSLRILLVKDQALGVGGEHQLFKHKGYCASRRGGESLEGQIVEMREIVILGALGIVANGENIRLEVFRPKIQHLSSNAVPLTKVSPAFPEQLPSGSSGAGSSKEAALYLDAAREVKLSALVWHVLATRDAQDLHALVVPQAGEQLRRDEEVLRRVLVASDLDHALVHHALVARVHALIYLVDHAEGSLSHRLERHEVEDGGYGALAAGLAVLVELLERLVLSRVQTLWSVGPHHKKSLHVGDVCMYLNLTLISMAHLSKSSSLWTLTSPAQLICSKL